MQWGFDETTLDGVSTLNQWAMLQFPDEAESGGRAGRCFTIVTLECAGSKTDPSPHTYPIYNDPNPLPVNLLRRSTVRYCAGSCEAYTEIMGAWKRGS
jgi:hypothetical protein